MKKLAPYLVISLLIFLALIPPINFFVSRPENDAWYILVLLMGFFGIFTVFIDTPWFIRVIAIWSFGLCFVCGSPLTALTSYASIIICCYLYTFSRWITDWSIIFKPLQALLFLNSLVIIMQIMGKDSLLNFGLGHDISTYGIVGPHMQMGSFSIVLAAVLLSFSPWNLIFPLVVALFCTSAWTLFTVGVGFFMFLKPHSKKWAHILLVLSVGVFLCYSFYTNKFHANIGPHSGREQVWINSMHWANYHPWVGWGAGTYKLLFPSFYLTPEHIVPYKSAHNWLIQLVFEMGYPFTIFIVSLILNLVYRLWRARQQMCLIGLVMILIDAEVHFPERMLQTVGIIICFLAYCETRLRRQ